MKRNGKIALWVALGVVGAIVQLVLILFLLAVFAVDRVEDTDPAHYTRYFGAAAEEKYVTKWGIGDSIFPADLDGMTVNDFHFLYYDPWDAQYLGYLSVTMEDAAYRAERERLAAFPEEDYVGIYSVEEFPEGTLLAMNADAYQGFVYALDAGENTIVYVEIIFCNYFLDVSEKKVIPEEYLPPHFDASSNNPYRKAMLSDTD